MKNSKAWMEDSFRGDDSVLRGASVKAAVFVAELEAREAAGDYGWLCRPNWRLVRRATRAEWEQQNEAAFRMLDPDATIDVPGVGPCIVKHLVLRD